MVNLQPEMSRNYPPGSNSANMGANPGQHNPSMHPNRPHPSSQHSGRNTQRSGPPHHHGHYQQQYNQRPIQPNRPVSSQDQPMSDHFDYRVLENANYPYCPDHSKYEHITKIGQGTFGEVHKAKIRTSGQIVALKKVLTENEKEGVGFLFKTQSNLINLLVSDYSFTRN